MMKSDKDLPEAHEPGPADVTLREVTDADLPVFFGPARDTSHISERCQGAA